LEFTDEAVDWDKNIKQGQGLRVGSRGARSARRVVPTAEGKGSVTIEATSKGMGLWWQAALGTSTSTVVSGATYQQVHTLTTSSLAPALTLQKGSVQVGGTIDAQTYTGVTVEGWELNFPNADIATVKFNLDAADVSTATGYATPTYPATPNAVPLRERHDLHRHPDRAHVHCPGFLDDRARECAGRVDRGQQQPRDRPSEPRRRRPEEAALRRAR
jgi:hypothetical protein